MTFNPNTMCSISQLNTLRYLLTNHRMLQDVQYRGHPHYVIDFTYKGKDYAINERGDVLTEVTQTQAVVTREEFRQGKNL